MASKRPVENEGSVPPVKKRGGFKVGPDNLPDGTWRRKGMELENDRGEGD